MLEKMNLDVSVEKAIYKEEKDRLSLKLGAFQRKIKELGIPVLIIFEGWNAAGKGTLINDLMIPLDPRNFVVYNPIKPSDDEINRPLLWRYWSKTPEKGRMVLFDRGYYGDMVHWSETSKSDMKCTLRQANDFERVLSENGTIIIKFFVHISKKEQKKRFEKLEKNKSTGWRVTKADWRENKNYDNLLSKLDRVLETTDTECAPWTLIEGHDKEYACLKIYNTIASRLQHEIEKRETAPTVALKPLVLAGDDPYRTSVLGSVNMDKTLDRETYKEELKKCQKKLRDLEYQIYNRRIPVIIGFEGWDAGGKGGAIKRICEDLDPRGYRVHPTAAPTYEEFAHNWLWRFWNTVPKRGHFSIYDRTWYGRVMVEPIEGFCSADEYHRAFREINDFEKQLTDDGTVVLKFWMNITKEEQEKRFKEREQDPDKQWKITDEDWRNREKWDAYVVAVDRMLLKTSTEKAPWIVVEGNDKYFARIKVLKAVIEAIEKKIAKSDD